MTRIPVYRLYAEDAGLVEVSGRPSVSRPGEVAELFRRHIGQVAQEYFVVFILNTKNRINGIQTISIGTLNGALVEPREVFALAILKSAHAIILAHNHPSGDTTPSEEDRLLTTRLEECGRLLKIKVLDHVIVAGPRYLSFREAGLMTI